MGKKDMAYPFNSIESGDRKQDGADARDKAGSQTLPPERSQLQKACIM